MKPFEFAYLCASPFLLPLHSQVRRMLREITRTAPGRLRILDVGGRKSPYTIGVPAEITITDIPRESAVQKQMNLGINEAIVQQHHARRSNVRGVIYDDMTRSKLPDNSYDCIVAVEVLEHVEEYDQFLGHVHRVLKPAGRFIMTTPNGDFVANTNPDHKRHFTRELLHGAIAAHFQSPEVFYAVRAGRSRSWGLNEWSLAHPVNTFKGMSGNLLNRFLSSGAALRQQATGTHHLVAVARKQEAESRAGVPPAPIGEEGHCSR